MTTRPGYIWSGTEWVSIGQEAVVAPVSYQTSAPSTPSAGDIWIDSDDDVPGIDTSQFLRWRKTAVGGETSVSGTDDNGLTLQYTANYEQVYLNGVLLVRGQDYTATNGTSITGLTALAANDVVEVFGVVARVVGDVYTQAQADAKYSLQTTTGLVLLNTTTFTSASTVSVDNVFSSAYDHYKVILNTTSASGAGGYSIRLRVSGSDNTTFNYRYHRTYWNSGSSANQTQLTNSSFYIGSLGQNGSLYEMNFGLPFATQRTYLHLFGVNNETSDVFKELSVGTFNTTTSFTGFTFYPDTGNITGTVKIYGIK